MWDNPLMARFLKRLASFSRLIMIDRRGMGLSDRLSPDDLPPIEELVDDIDAVLDAVGSERAVMGDGFLATFDGPARGVRCAEAIAAQVQPLGVEIRAGLHTGDVVFEGDDVAGLGVAIRARVGAKAGANEVLVSQTVKDLVAGSGLTFEDPTPGTRARALRSGCDQSSRQVA